jgi:hypothetical protein
MKKWLLLIAAILAISLSCIYIFIPSTINISDIITANATRDGTYRMIASKNEWKRWWKYRATEKDLSTDITFNNNGYNYSLLEPGFNSALISIEHQNKTVATKMSLLQFETDSIAVMWQCDLHATINPFQRVNQYFEAVNTKKNMEKVLGDLKAFIEKDENIYGFKISETTVRDSLLISKKQLFTQQPTMQDVYNLIDDLKLYAAKNNCIQTDAPMLNILHDSDRYRVMVALPINKEIITLPPISFVKMVTGNFMATQAKGGLLTVQNALQQMQLYFSDYDKTPMAITFQYLVTDRIKETDTTKWITEIYAPVL